jgi:hypothetical protein
MKITEPELPISVEFYISRHKKLWFIWQLLIWQTPVVFKPNQVEIMDNFERTEKHIRIELT